MKSFDLNKYLGEWYEIGRIPNKFEPNMINVSAKYILQSDGNIKVINSGYINGKLIRIVGEAIPTDLNTTLLVSFDFKNYSEYNILYVNSDYTKALVGGEFEDKLWILSRNPSMNKNNIDELLYLAENKGYDVNKFIITTK